MKKHHIPSLGRNVEHVAKKVPSKEASGDMKDESSREEKLTPEIWLMIMDYMDSLTLHSMTLVNTRMKVLAEEKVEKLKSNFEGIFVNIHDMQEILWSPHKIMETFVIVKEGTGFVVTISTAIVINLQVVQRQQVAAIRLRPSVHSPPVVLDYNEEDQTTEVGYNLTMVDNNTYKLEMVWSMDYKQTLLLDKGEGSLTKTVRSAENEVTAMFTQVPRDWLYFVKNPAGLVTRLDVTNIKLRTSRRKGVQISRKQLISRLLALPQINNNERFGLNKFKYGEFYPYPGPLEVGGVELRVERVLVIAEENIEMDVDIDHREVLRRSLQREIAAGGVVMNMGFKFVGVDIINEGVCRLVQYKVVNMSSSPACLVKRLQQVRVIENAAR